jgi:hypothetical protein
MNQTALRPVAAWRQIKSAHPSRLTSGRSGAGTGVKTDGANGVRIDRADWKRIEPLSRGAPGVQRCSKSAARDVTVFDVLEAN